MNATPALTIKRAARTLFWDSRWGVAFFDGIHCDLLSPPRLPSLALEQIDYAPLVGQRMVLERGGEWRALTAAECEEIDQLLGRMVNTVRRILC